MAPSSRPDALNSPLPSSPPPPRPLSPPPAVTLPQASPRRHASPLPGAQVASSRVPPAPNRQCTSPPPPANVKLVQDEVFGVPSERLLSSAGMSTEYVSPFDVAGRSNPNSVPPKGKEIDNVTAALFGPSKPEAESYTSPFLDLPASTYSQTKEYVFGPNSGATSQGVSKGAAVGFMNFIDPDMIQDLGVTEQKKKKEKGSKVNIKKKALHTRLLSPPNTHLAPSSNGDVAISPRRVKSPTGKEKRKKAKKSKDNRPFLSPPAAGTLDKTDSPSSISFASDVLYASQSSKQLKDVKAVPTSKVVEVLLYAEEDLSLRIFSKFFSNSANPLSLPLSPIQFQWKWKHHAENLIVAYLIGENDIHSFLSDIIHDVAGNDQPRNFKLLVGLLWIVLEHCVQTFRLPFIQYIMGIRGRDAVPQFEAGVDWKSDDGVDKYFENTESKLDFVMCLVKKLTWKWIDAYHVSHEILFGF